MSKSGSCTKGGGTPPSAEKGVPFFRFAEATDVPSLQRLYRQLLPDEETDGEAMAEALEDILKTEDCRVVVAVLDGEVVGTCQFVCYENLVRAPRRKAIIDSVVVHEKCRGKGVGTAMLNWVTGVLREYGCVRVGVSSNYSRTGAPAFYKKCRFNPFGNYYIFDCKD